MLFSDSQHRYHHIFDRIILKCQSVKKVVSFSIIIFVRFFFFYINTWKMKRATSETSPTCSMKISNIISLRGFPGGSDGKESACNAGDPSLIPGWIPWRRKMAIHSNILAWKIPWTEEPGSLQSKQSQSQTCLRD